MRILVFGDSITQGYSDSQGGWVRRLQQSYNEEYTEGSDEYPHSLFNLGVSGDSSNDLLIRFDNETTARTDEELAFVIAIGVNDSRTKAGTDYSNVRQYKQNLEEILNQARKHSDKILFVGLTPCDEPRSNPVPWGDTGYTNARIKEFDNALGEFCKHNKINLVTIYKPFKEARAKTELLPDSVHPNDEGHQLIADLVKPELDKLIET